MEKQDITFAKPEDISQIVGFGYSSFDENLLEGLGVSPSFNKTLLNVTDWVINNAVFVKRNEENEKFVDGCCCCLVQKSWWSEDPVLSIALYYIKQEKRTFTLAKQLLEAAQEYAIIHNIPLTIDLIGQKDIERKKKLLKHLGFIELGTLFVFYNQENEEVN